METEKYLNYQELSEVLGLTVGTLQHWVSADYIPHYKLGKGVRGAVRFKLSDVEKWTRTRMCPGRKEYNNPFENHNSCSTIRKL